MFKENLIRGFRHTPTPEQIEEADTWQRDYLTIIDPQEIEMYHPGFSSGELFDKNYDPEQWVPTDRMLDCILFAGTGVGPDWGPVDDPRRFELLERYFVQKLEEFDGYELYSHREGKMVPQHLDLDKIMVVKNTVDEFMKGQSRRSGEPAVSHIYRTTLRVLDTIRAINAGFQRGVAFNIDETTAQNAILLALLHDFTEDTFDQPDGTIRKGQCTFEVGIPGSSQLRFKIVHVNPSGDMEIESESSIEVSPFDAPVLAVNLNALVTDGKDITISRSIEESMTAFSERYYWNDREMLLAAIVKNADRNDNLDTIWFTRKNGVIVPEDPERVKRKLDETMQEFSPIEYAVLQRMHRLDGYFPNQPEKPDWYYPLYNTIMNVEFARYLLPIVRKLPTRKARLMGMGLSPMQILRAPIAEGLPYVI